MGTYFEYDLSKMVNSKGGFLVEDGKEIDEDSRRKEKERELQRAMQNLDPRAFIDQFEVSIPDHELSGQLCFWIPV
jgi:DNA-repair protein complementing XP-A cells